MNQYKNSQLIFPKITASSLKESYQQTCRHFKQIHAIQRLYNKEPDLWKIEEQFHLNIIERLGWLNSPSYFLNQTDEILHFTEEILKADFKYVVLLGMGGSSLSSEVAKEAFTPKEKYLKLFVLDSTSPEAILNIEAQIELEKTLFIVASKSGGTMETMQLYKYFFNKVQSFKAEKTGENFIAITDAESHLEQIAKEKSFRKVFINPVDIGGRFSVLSFFGLVPMAFMGIDIAGLLKSAQAMVEACKNNLECSENPGFLLGALLAVCENEKRNKITFLLSDTLKSFGYWVEQLIAESLGKEGKGLIPVIDEPYNEGIPYGNDRLFVHIQLEEDMKDEGFIQYLKNKNLPLVELEISSTNDLGALFYLWEVAIAVAAISMKIDPFDQPNVEESKILTKKLLADKNEINQFSSNQITIENDFADLYFGSTFTDLHSIKHQSIDDIFRFIKTEIKSHEYIALLPYFFLTPERKTILQAFRSFFQKDNLIATTLLEGPRYLHSTGQLHKGGIDNGYFIIFTKENGNASLSIPEEDFDFNTLILAQAIGDFNALCQKGKKVIRIHIKKDLEDSLKRFI